MHLSTKRSFLLVPVCTVLLDLSMPSLQVNIQDLPSVFVILEHKRLWGILGFNIACVLLTWIGLAP